MKTHRAVLQYTIHLCQASIGEKAGIQVSHANMCTEQLYYICIALLV